MDGEKPKGHKTCCGEKLDKAITPQEYKKIHYERNKQHYKELNLRPVECNVCGKVLAKNYLKRHKLSLHCQIRKLNAEKIELENKLPK